MPTSTLRVAMTVDDLFMWPGLPCPESSSPPTIARQLVDAFANNGVEGVYAFSCTRPVEGSSTLPEVLDLWCDAGHYVGNHTHYHCALNWCSAESYAHDMDRSARVLRPWIERAPARFFRFAFDMWGDAKDKTDRVMLELARTGFRYAPISMWFADTLFMFPHLRATKQGNARVVAEIEDLFVETWMAQLEGQAAAARSAMGRDVTHIALVHGVPLAGATMDRICRRMIARGVTFVSLEEAMRDPFNAIAPPVCERRFRNTTQKWCAVTGTEVPSIPPQLLAELATILPIPGMDVASGFEACFAALAAGVEGKPVVSDFLE